MSDRIAPVVADLDDVTLRQQFHVDFSPIGWHLGHAAWQRERWVLREVGGLPPLAPEFDALFDTFRSRKGARGTRLPDARRLRSYVAQVDEAMELARSRHRGEPQFERAARLADNHERQHVEIVLCVRLLGRLYVEPVGPTESPIESELPEIADGPWIPVEGGTFRLGAPRGDASDTESALQKDVDEDAWDNEHEAHEVHIDPFLMRRHPVSEAEWLGWMHAGGYERREWWSPEGWSWRTHHGVVAPGHWERSADGRWYRRALCGPTLAGGARPVAHVSWYEADAYARSQGARLPTEAEWERAASDARDKRRYPWGPSFEVGRADLGRCSGDCAVLGAHPRGASPSGIEDLCGGVWEWVADHFAPYPGFVPGRYAEYSAPWFGARHRVARGGSWLTAPSNARVTFRNWYEPHVRQPCLGVRLVRDA